MSKFRAAIVAESYTHLVDAAVEKGITISNAWIITPGNEMYLRGVDRKLPWATVGDIPEKTMQEARIKFLTEPKALEDIAHLIAMDAA